MTFAELAAARRSVRRYENRAVPEEVLDSLLETACLAPSAGNLQSWHFYAVTSAKVRGELFPCLRYPMPWFVQAPVVIVVAADRAKIEPRYKARGLDLFCLQDTAAATQTLLLAACEQGLGTCWIGSFDEGECARTVGIPDELRPVAMIALGYPAESPPPRPRLPLDKVVTYVR